MGAVVKLHLGVLVQPYRSRSRKVSATSTGDVAEILEAKYGVMQAFYRAHQSEITQGISESLRDAFEALASGHVIDPWGASMQSIQTQFRDFISSGQAERVGIPGTPTAAALRGVNHRLKHPYRKSNPRRPSFRDTGLYMASMRAWVD